MNFSPYHSPAASSDQYPGGQGGPGYNTLWGGLHLGAPELFPSPPWIYSEEHQGDCAEKPSPCLACRKVAESFRSGCSRYESFHPKPRPNFDCHLTLGTAMAFQDRISCSTCQSIWQLVKGRRCPSDSKASICESCTVRLSYTKVIPTGYGHFLILEVSTILVVNLCYPILVPLKATDC
jgi:hypothetical protein